MRGIAPAMGRVSRQAFRKAKMRKGAHEHAEQIARCPLEFHIILSALDFRLLALSMI
jgi:hypothetical protein